MIYIPITIDDNGEYKDLQSITIHLQGFTINNNPFTTD